MPGHKLRKSYSEKRRLQATERYLTESANNFGYSEEELYDIILSVRAIQDLINHRIWEEEEEEKNEVLAQYYAEEDKKIRTRKSTES